MQISLPPSPHLFRELFVNNLEGGKVELKFYALEGPQSVCFVPTLTNNIEYVCSAPVCGQVRSRRGAESEGSFSDSS